MLMKTNFLIITTQKKLFMQCSTLEASGDPLPLGRGCYPRPGLLSLRWALSRPPRRPATVFTCNFAAALVIALPEG